MRLKRISEILSRLIDATLVNTDEINDFTTGSVVMSLYEAFAMEIEQFYMLTRENIMWGIQNGVLNAFGFYRREARRAYGTVTIEFHTTTQGILYIPRGTAFTSAQREFQQQYELLEDVYIPKGVVTYDVQVYCTQAGTVGNVDANMVNVLLNGLSNVKKVYNETDILTGTDAEKYEDLRNRFRAFIETRGRATVKALDYGARQVEDVAGVYVHELVGYVEMFVHDMNGELPDNLRNEVIEAIEDYRPAGIKLDVFPVVKRTVDLTVIVTLTDKLRISETLRSMVKKTLSDYLNTMQVSEDVVIADLVQTVMNIDDYLIYDCELPDLEGNIIVENEELVRAGTILVELK